MAKRVVEFTVRVEIDDDGSESHENIERVSIVSMRGVKLLENMTSVEFDHEDDAATVDITVGEVMPGVIASVVLDAQNVDDGFYCSVEVGPDGIGSAITAPELDTAPPVKRGYNSAFWQR